LASYFGEYYVVDLLLSKGADPNVKDQNGMSPLHYAAASSQLSIIQLLNEKGKADLNVRDDLDRTGILVLHFKSCHLKLS
jgi:ankyrin repeat protein